VFGIALGLAGCVAEDKPLLVSPISVDANRPTAPTRAYVVRAPATEATEERVLSVAQRVLEANPKLGARPVFTTVGVPQPELFHRGPAEGVVQGSQVYISEGLVQRCRNEGQLAALLCYELGRIVSERESLAGPVAARHVDPPLDVPDSPDSGGLRGPSDYTRRMELARAERERQPRPNRPTPPPDPVVLARRYLVQSGFGPEALDEVMPWVRQAEQGGALEQTLTR
jgi:hypothetical protein